MKPGIYYGIPWAEYRAIDLPSPSMLKHGLRSMKRLRRALDGECQPSEKVTTVGNAVHCMVADEFDERFAVMPSFESWPQNVTASGKPSTSKSTAFYKASAADWIENNARTVITDVQKNVAAKAVREIYNNRHALELIANSRQEATVIADIDGVLCKTRIDFLQPDARHAADLKTTSDIAPSAIYRKCKQMDYFFQFAFHSIALANAGADWLQIQSYDVLAVETQDDYDVGVIQLIPFSVVQSWEDKVYDVVGQYKRALKSGEWPGLYPNKDIIQVPDWDMSETKLDWGDNDN